MSRPLSIALAGALVVAGVAAVGMVIDDDADVPPAIAAADPHADAAGATSTTLSRAERAERAERRAARLAAASTVPPSTEAAGPAPADAASCPSTPHGAVIDRANQRAWLCADGAVYDVMPITTAASQPDPGTYDVYAKDMQTTSTFGDRPSTLDRFVAFTNGKYTGARIAFHAIPRYSDGTLAQTPESVGSAELYGASSGCIRVLPDDAVVIWDFLSIGDEVRVVS